MPPASTKVERGLSVRVTVSRGVTCVRRVGLSWRRCGLRETAKVEGCLAEVSDYCLQLQRPPFGSLGDQVPGVGFACAGENWQRSLILSSLPLICASFSLFPFYLFFWAELPFWPFICLLFGGCLLFCKLALLLVLVLFLFLLLVSLLLLLVVVVVVLVV